MLYQQISDEIKQAMKAKDSEKLSVLRMVKTRIMTEDARGELPDEKIIEIIKKYHKSLRDAADQAEKVGRLEEAEQSRKEMTIVDIYLPKMLDEDQTRLIIKGIIDANGYTEKKQLGLIMKELMSKHKAELDGSIAKKILDELLI